MHSKTPDTYQIPQKQPYKKLEALGRIVVKRHDQIKDMVEYCKVFLDLQFSLASFEELKTAAIG